MTQVSYCNLRLPPLMASRREVRLHRWIEKLDQLETYSEADVREEIIRPILLIMGYEKESIFSVERETTLKILNKRLSVDYNLTLWEENYWVIEAKKPNVTKGKFKYAQLW